MAVTLEWVRDNYDADRDRYINANERKQAVLDRMADTGITKDQTNAVIAAYEAHTLLPDYGTTTPTHIVAFVVPNGSILNVDGVVIL